MLNRRSFLGVGLTASVGLNSSTSFARPDETTAESPQIRDHVTLGRTGLKISDISFGSSRLADPRLVRYAVDRGITYFDTAESYRFGDSENAIRRGLKGVRDRVVISTKSKSRATDSADAMMSVLDKSLKRLGTDYVDIYFNHAVNDVARLQNTAWWEFTERAKRQGKIRFRGVSGHGSRLVECLHFALDNDLVDVVLAAYNFGLDPAFFDRVRQTFHFVALQPELPPVLAKAHDKGVGVIAMKTLMGARLNDMRPFEQDGGTYAQAAFRWTLSRPHVDGLIVSMTSREDMDEYVRASGSRRIRQSELALLSTYAAMQTSKYCQHGCGDCESACPAGVQISEVLRARMYAVDYGDVRFAREDYGKLNTDAAPCLTCTAQPCRGACPGSLPIPHFMREAVSRLA